MPPEIRLNKEAAEECYQSLLDYYTHLHVHTTSVAGEIHHHIITLTDKDEYGDPKTSTIELAMFEHNQ